MQGIWPRNPGAHLAQASPGLSCASRACKDEEGPESPDNSWQSFQAYNGPSTLLGSLRKAIKAQVLAPEGGWGGGGHRKSEQRRQKEGGGCRE